MPLDPRIPLMADQIVLPDRLAAQQRRQTVQANRMAMEAQQAATQRNAMLRSKASLVDFTNPQQTASFASLGEGTEPYVENARGVQSMATAQFAEARAAAEEERKHRDEGFKLIGQGLLGALADPSDMGLTTIRSSLEAQGIPADQLEPIIGPIMRLPPDQRSGAVRQFVATNETARQALEFVSPKPVEVNLGDRVAFIDANPNSPTYNQEVRSDAVGINPNQPVQIVQGAAGAYALPRGGEGEADLITAGGAPIGLPPTAQQQNATGGDARRQQAASSLLSSIDAMRGDYARLNELGAMVSSESQSPLENIGASIGASLPGRIVGRAVGSEAQTRRDNISNMRGHVIATLKDLTGLSAQQLNSNVELKLFLDTLGREDQSIETINAAMDRFAAYAARPDAFSDLMGGGQAQGGGYREGEVRYNSAGDGVRYTNGQWVPL